MTPLLSLNAGFVDTVGFLGLQVLCAAHVTGNFVTLASGFGIGVRTVKLGRPMPVARKPIR